MSKQSDYEAALNASFARRQREAEQMESLIECKRLSLYEQKLSDLYDTLNSNGRHQDCTAIDELVRRVAEYLIEEEKRDAYCRKWEHL